MPINPWGWFPPGSGKTWTLLSLIDVVCYANRVAPDVSTGPLLVCADTNTAVNNLVEGLVEKQINVVRIGPPAKAREGLRHVTLDARAQATKLGEFASKKQAQAESLKMHAQKVLKSPTCPVAVSNSHTDLLVMQTCPSAEPYEWVCP